MGMDNANVDAVSSTSSNDYEELDVDHSDVPGEISSICFDSPTTSRSGTIAQIEGVIDDHTVNEHDERIVEQVINDQTDDIDMIYRNRTDDGDGDGGDDDITDIFDALRRSSKHVFVLSEAGKPIYTTKGNEERMSPVFMTIQTLVLMTEIDDELRSFDAANVRVCFSHRSPLILCIATANRAESPTRLHTQLDLVHQHIISVLTRTSLTRVFECRENFDLRRLLKGTERSLNAVTPVYERDPAVFLNAVRILPMASSDRDAIGQAIASSATACKVKNLVFAILVSRRQLVTVVRMKKYTLHPADLHIIVNLVSCNPSFMDAESWSPICLPHFDDSGFLHAHISYLSDACSACLLLLTIDRNAFFTLSTMRAKVVEKIVKTKLLLALNNACDSCRCFDLDQLGYTDLWHFVYKNRTSSQMCSALFRPPYASVDERQHLISGYADLADQVHNWPDDGTLRILFRPLSEHTLLAWITNNFELYCAFTPFVQKASAVSKIEKLLKALKKEEDRLFLNSTHTFS